MKQLSLAGPALVERDAPRPSPGPGELLVRVRAAGVTPTELLWYPTTHRNNGEPRAGAVPGHEFSGTVEALADNAGGLAIGADVFGMNDWFADGAMGEYCVAPFTSIAPKPARLSHIEAASVPIGALTAWQGLYDRARIQAGERILVHGGAGAVGVFAVQLAALRGAHVIATASARNLDLVAELGAAEVIDYHGSAFEKLARDLDVVFDTVGGETLARSWDLLKSGGRMVTIAAAGETAEGRTKDAFFIVEPNRNQLAEVAKLLDTGKLRTVVDTVVPFAEAARAFTGSIARRGRGKVVVELPAAGPQN